MTVFKPYCSVHIDIGCGAYVGSDGTEVCRGCEEGVAEQLVCTGPPARLKCEGELQEVSELGGEKGPRLYLRSAARGDQVHRPHRGLLHIGRVALDTTY